MTNTKVYNFTFESLTRNKHYLEGVQVLDESGLTESNLRSCLLYHNVDKQNHHHTNEYLKRGENKSMSLFQKTYDKQGQLISDELVISNKYFVQTQPKWTSHLVGSITDINTGEYITDVGFSITDLESATKRKRKAIKKYSDVYEPLYQKKKISCMFITLTRANVAMSQTDIRKAIDNIKKRFNRHGIDTYGHLWVSEVSSHNHWHYHIAISTSRVRWKVIPQWAKFNDLWTQRTQIEFIRKSIASYLGKYIGKDNKGRLIGFRQYGISRNLSIPNGKYDF